MGEIDTKPIESVQSSLSLFGEKNERRKFRSTGSEGKLESEKEKDFEIMLKDMANYKVQLEVKEYDYKQALLKLASYRKTVDELSNKLTSSTSESDQLRGYCRETEGRIDELESKVKEMSDLLLEAGNVREQLLEAVNELKITQEELLSVKNELTATEESKLAAMTQVEEMSIAVNKEKEKSEELLKHVSELNEAILHSKLTAIEAEKEKSTILSEKEDEIRMATEAAVQAQEQLEEIRNQVDGMQELENQLSEKTQFIDSLQLELMQEKMFHSSSEKAATDAINDLNRLKSELQLMEKVNSDQSTCMKSMEAEMNQLQLEFKNAKDEVDHLNLEIGLLTGEIKKAKIEMDEIRGRESEAEIEIALLKSELHKGRSKIAAAEAAEARARCFKSGVYLAVKQLAIEAQNAKTETQNLKQEIEKAKAEEETESFTFYNPQIAECMPLDIPQEEESRTRVRDDTNVQITISMKEYESLIQKAEKEADQVTIFTPDVASGVVDSASLYELHALRAEVEAAKEENEELRSAVEQAMIRAEMAERAKTAVEDQLRKWREHQQKQRVASVVLPEESAPKESNLPKYGRPSKYDRIPASYQPLPLPLHKVLNMKF